MSGSWEERERRSGFERLLPKKPLRRDREHGILGGVCAGLAAAYGIRRWKIRLVVIVLLFFPINWAIVGSYLLAWILIEPKTTPGVYADAGAARAADTADGPESRVSMVELRARRARLESRLRRLETYVTSKRYRLDEEFRNLG